MMDRIVYKPVKVDFHIHSVYSKYKDNELLVSNNTEDNLNILFDKLKEFQVNVASITDHDFFSYSMYKKFKSFEGVDCLKKVLPGVEFSVGLQNEKGEIKDVHVIVIFDDKDEEKIKKIEQQFSIIENKIDYKNGDHSFFTEEHFWSILSNIGLNAILIAHQKNSITSNKQAKNDLMSVGEKNFENYLICEYFDALEFKSMKNGLFNNLYAFEKNKEYDLVRFITGSDCHQWYVYPKHDSNDIEDKEFNYTYLKCLPTFKGVAMAITDYSRITLSDSIFSIDEEKIENIEILIKNKLFNIPISKGINAIIGDNSIGKSLLIHKLTNYHYLDNQLNVKKGYENYLVNENISIKSLINKKIYSFDSQGNIRKRFEENNEEKNHDFLDSKFPKSINSSIYISMLNSYLDQFYKKLENKFSYDKELRKLKTLFFVTEELSRINLVVNQIENSNETFNNVCQIISYLNEINSFISSGDKMIDLGLEIEDFEILKEFSGKIHKIREKYINKKILVEKEFNIKSIMNSGINKFNEELLKYKNNLEQVSQQFDRGIDASATSIVKLLNYKLKMKEYDFIVKEPLKVEPVSLPFGEYKFVKRFKNIKEINTSYLISLIERVCKRNNTIDIDAITENKLREILPFDKRQININPIELLKMKINDMIKDDFTVEGVILKKEQDDYDNLSMGLNSTLYFDIISEDEEEGMYFIDQPEDDVSQKSIKTNLIKDFKNMSKKRQIFLITHNPQFVVNLDVDNIICIIKNKEGNIDIKYGALEYEDEETNIIKEVAENLDGGVEAIRKRWKRYEKEIKF